jgi:hypothetical protein
MIMMLSLSVSPNLSKAVFSMIGNPQQEKLSIQNRLQLTLGEKRSIRNIFLNPASEKVNIRCTWN